MLARFREQMADYARGERLKALRNERHLSQEDAAYEIGVSVKSLRTWEHGGGIKWANAKTTGEFYGVDPETLITREGSELAPEPLERLEGKVDRVLELLESGLAVQAAIVADQSSARSDQRSSRVPPSKPKKRAGGSRRA